MEAIQVGEPAREPEVVEWVWEEVGHAALGDGRRTRRLVRLVDALAAQPTASLPRACGSWAATKAAYRFLGNEQIAPEDLRAVLRERTLARLQQLPPAEPAASEAPPAGQPVLALQDTTELDFTPHAATQGLGTLSAVRHRGLHVHTVLAVSAAGVPQGVLHQAVWARPEAERGKAQTRRRRPTAEKESQRWLDAAAVTQAAVPAPTPVVVVGDREADIFALLAQERPAHSHLLVRSTQNRSCRALPTASTSPAAAVGAAAAAAAGAPALLEDLLAQVPVGGEVLVATARRAGQPARAVRLRVRWCTLALQPPRHPSPGSPTQEVPVQVVVAEEAPEAVPAGASPLRWVLLTTWPVSSLEVALRVVQWYALRWLIERYHFVLKSGCRLEALQVEQAHALERALAVYSIVAWRLLWLTYQARQTPAAPATLALTPAEWQAAYLATHPGTALPTVVPTLSQAVRWIAQLGGFLGRARDGDPGVATLWRGWQRLQDLVAGWHLAAQAPPPLPSH